MKSFPRALGLGLVMLAGMSLGPATASAATEPASSAGRVKFVKRTGPEFDRFTRTPAPGFAEWMRAKFWRAEVFTPYFDAKNAWYPNGWVYEDLYSIYRDSALERAHPEWILRD